MLLSTCFIAGVLLGTLTLLAWRWIRTRDELRIVRINAETLGAAVTELTRQMAQMHTTAVPLNVALQAVLIQELTHLHTPQVDRLLAKLGSPFQLTEAEEQILLLALRQREQDMGEEITESERDAARILPLLLKRIKRELEHPSGASPVTDQIVTLTAPPLEAGR